MKKYKAFMVVFLFGILGAATISVLAARTQGYDAKNIAAYDCSFTTSSNTLKGYTNVSFIVSYDTIKDGFEAYADIYISSNDLMKSGYQRSYVAKGTNYAHTGTLKIEGYKKGTSTHKMVYAAESVDHTVSLSL